MTQTLNFYLNIAYNVLSGAISSCSTLERGGEAHDPLESWLGPKYSRTLDTLWPIDSQKKIVKLMPPDVRF